MKPKYLEPIKHSFDVEDRQESCPVTPVNRSFPSNLDPTFATAILSPSSNEVFAARTRARSRSEACLMRNEEDALPSLSTVKKPKLMINPDECVSKDRVDESSIEQSMDETDFSMSRMKLETPDTSRESFRGDTSIDFKLPNAILRPILSSRTPSTVSQDKSDKNLPFNAQSKLQIMRKKSNTISMPADKAPKFQDIFGPKLTLDDNCQPPHNLFEDNRSDKVRPSHPRRMTIGGPASILRSAFSTVKPTEKLRHKPSLRSVTEGTILENISQEFRLQSKPSGSKSGDKPTKSRSESQNSSQTSYSDPNDESSIAFQYLIQGLSKERPLHSAVLSEMEPVADQSLNAVMEYRSTSPTEKERKRNSGPPCDLCGAIALRMTVLEPCQHLACAACCSSGLNQVTATPPRPHVCAACHTPVKGINLRKSSISESSNNNTESSGSIYKRTRTPSYDDDRRFYIQGKVTSSPLTAWSHHVGFTESYGKSNLDESKRYTMLRSSTPDLGILALSGIVDSSDSAADDASFLAASAEYPYLVTQNQGFGKVVPMTFEIPTSQNVQVNLESNRTSVVVRLDNIPWKLTYNDVVEWLPDKSEKMLPDKDRVAQAVHIPIDIVSGKTANCCFVECRNKVEAKRFVRHRNNTRLLGRPVSLILTTYEDLLNEIFPFRLMSPRKDEENCIYFTPGIMAQIVQLLKLGSAQLKGPVKVVDLTTSMVRLVPTVLHEKLRDILFERVKEIVCTCIVASSELSGIHESLNRLLLASSTCACFTVDQRIDILDSARRALNAVAKHYT